MRTSSEGCVHAFDFFIIVKLREAAQALQELGEEPIEDLLPEDELLELSVEDLPEFSYVFGEEAEFSDPDVGPEASHPPPGAAVEDNAENAAACEVGGEEACDGAAVEEEGQGNAEKAAACEIEGKEACDGAAVEEEGQGNAEKAAACEVEGKEACDGAAVEEEGQGNAEEAMACDIGGKEACDGAALERGGQEQAEPFQALQKQVPTGKQQENPAVLAISSDEEGAEAAPRTSKVLKASAANQPVATPLRSQRLDELQKRLALLMLG